MLYGEERPDITEVVQQALEQESPSNGRASGHVVHVRTQHRHSRQHGRHAQHRVPPNHEQERGCLCTHVYARKNRSLNTHDVTV